MRQIEETEKQLSEWAPKAGGLRLNQIAVVTRGNVEKSSLAGMSSLAGHPVTGDLAEWRRGNALLLVSLYRFKGLEADALILVDAVKPEPQAPPTGFRPEHFYVASSRAKHLLTVVSHSPF